jgi:hypothetical protein
MTRRAVLFCALVFFLGGCVARRFALTEATNAPHQATQGFAWVPQEVWSGATVVQVLDAETFLVNVPLLKRSVTLSLFGVRARSKAEPDARQRVLDRIEPGSKVTVEVLARSETGRPLVRLLDAQGDVAKGLLEIGAADLFVICRKASGCTPAQLEALGVGALARACQRSARGVQDHGLDDRLSRERVQWVIDFEDGTFVSLWQRHELPPCQRVYFSASALAAAAGLDASRKELESMGFVSRAVSRYVDQERARAP